MYHCTNVQCTNVRLLWHPLPGTVVKQLQLLPLEKGSTNATSERMHLLVKAIWGCTWWKTRGFICEWFPTYHPWYAGSLVRADSGLYFSPRHHSPKILYRSTILPSWSVWNLDSRSRWMDVQGHPQKVLKVNNWYLIITYWRQQFSHLRVRIYPPRLLARLVL